MSDRLCVVMPVYNERDAIGNVLVKWDDELRRLGIDYEIRPYNDGSKDDSLAVMQAVAGKSSGRIAPRDKPNGGHGNTILTGYREAVADGFDWVFQVDSDDEMGPEKFGELWDGRDGFDFLVGIRDGRKQALPRKIISFVSRLCVRLFYGRSVWDVNTPYRLMRVSAFRDFFEEIPLSTFAPNVILSGLAARHGLRSHEIRVPQHDRATGEVSIKKWKLLKAAARSFFQTIGFALRTKPATGGVAGAGFARLSVVAACCLGMGVCALCICRWAFFVQAVICIFTAFWLGSRNIVSTKARSFSFWSERHCWAILLALVLTGIVFRSAILLGVNDLWALQTGDSPWFWKHSLSVAGGGFPECKSWVTSWVYGLAIAVFGGDVLVGVAANFVFHAATGVLLFILARRIFGSALPGIVASACFLLSPEMAAFSLRIYSEHVCYMLLVSFFVLLDIWRGRRRVYLSASAALLALAILWTRSDCGLLLFVLAPSLFAFDIIVCARCRRQSLLALAVFAGIVFAGVAMGRLVNERVHGIHTFLCSNDGWWPRLFGCNVRSGGRLVADMRVPSPDGTFVSNADKWLLHQRYEAATGKKLEMIPNHCPEELVPYIKEEIARRWGAMPLQKKCSFVIGKERHVFCRAGLRWGALRKAVLNLDVLRLVSCLLRLLVVLGTIVTLFRSMRQAFTWESEDCVRALFAFAPVIFCLGIVVVIAVAEASVRVGTITFVCMATYGAGVFSRCRPS